jgi:hypothetical protein
MRRRNGNASVITAKAIRLAEESGDDMFQYIISGVRIKTEETASAGPTPRGLFFHGTSAAPHSAHVATSARREFRPASVAFPSLIQYYLSPTLVLTPRKR